MDNIIKDSNKQDLNQDAKKNLNQDESLIEENLNKEKNLSEDEKILDEKQEPKELDKEVKSQDELQGDLQSDLIEAFNKQIEELKNENLRIYADFDNVKKRLQKDKDQSLEYAYEAIAKDLLPVLDSLNAALEASSKDENGLAIYDGLKLVLTNFTKVLNKNGISEIECSGEFDPNFHNCIMQIKDESKKDGEISKIMQKGYQYKQRLLRPALVALTKN